MDPRHFQLAALTGLLAFGTLHFDFRDPPWHVAVIPTVALATQWAGTRLVGLPRFDPRSPLISGLSLCLLLRTGSSLVAAAAAAIAIAS